MDSLQVKALLAGLFFGLWPLFMNRSGLSGNASAMAFAGLAFFFVSPFALSNWGDVSNVRWWMVVCSALLGSIGLLSFNGMLAKATPQSVGTLFVLVILVQTAVPAIYQIIMDGGISATKGIAFVLAGVSAVLLVKS